MYELIQLAIGSYGNGYKKISDIDMHIQAMNNLLDRGIITNMYGLTEQEILSIVMLEGFEYRLIQDAAFNNAPTTPFTSKLIKLLDSAINKAPKTLHQVLYRQDSYYSGVPKEGETIQIAGFWTTSVEDFDNTNDKKWIIKPLPPEETKAHDIYKIYNHGDEHGNGELQVEYERNTTFKIEKIVQHHRYLEICVSESH